MQTASPVDSNVALFAIQPRSALHAATSADAAELEETVKDRAVVPDIVLVLLFLVIVHVVGGDLLQELDILVRMKLSHLILGRRFSALLIRVLATCLLLLAQPQTDRKQGY